MRRGRLVAVRPAPEASPTELADLMVGAAPGALATPTGTPTPTRTPTATPAATRTGAPPLVVLRSASARSNRGHLALRGVDLELRAGEILAVAGVDGNGQVELAEVVAGLRPPRLRRR